MEKAFCILLGVLFVCGILANAIVLKYAIKEGTKRRKRGGNRDRNPRHVYVYIGAILSSDLLLLTNCPFIIHDLVNNGWYFGQFVCKFVYSNESFHKVLTGFLLAALSFDRLITVRKILSPKWRTVSTALISIGCCAIVDLILQLPVFIFADVHSLDDHEGEEETLFDSNSTPSNGSVLEYQPIETVEKCVLAVPDSVEPLISAFTVIIFIAGFCVPSVLILITYGTILHRMMITGYFSLGTSPRRPDTKANILRELRSNKHRRNGNRAITCYVSLLLIIYLACWGPYWIVSALKIGITDESADRDTPPGDMETYILLYLHLLPYLNAALNPFAYCYLVRCCCTGRKKKRTLILRPTGDTTYPMTECKRRWSLDETWPGRSGTTIKGKRECTITKSV